MVVNFVAFLLLPLLLCRHVSPFVRQNDVEHFVPAVFTWFVGNFFFKHSLNAIHLYAYSTSTPFLVLTAVHHINILLCCCIKCIFDFWPAWKKIIFIKKMNLCDLKKEQINFCTFDAKRVNEKKEEKNGTVETILLINKYSGLFKRCFKCLHMWDDFMVGAMHDSWRAFVTRNNNFSANFLIEWYRKLGMQQFTTHWQMDGNLACRPALWLAHASPGIANRQLYEYISLTATFTTREICKMPLRMYACVCVTCMSRIFYAQNYG